MKSLNLFVFYCVAVLFPAMSYGADTNVVVRDAWIREAPPNAVALAGYMTMENPSDQEQSLVSATSDSFGEVMIHRTVHEGGLARMIHQDAVAIPAKGKVSFEPNSYHLMLMKPVSSLSDGDKVAIKLIFSNDSTLDVTFDVRGNMMGKKGMSEMKCAAGKCGGGKCGGGKGAMKCGAGKCGGM